jgi:hypothetical protein
MRLTHAFLVIVDISGYTSFITERTISLLHAEQIITDLIDAVIDQARHPLTLNKLEGDAALLYGECAPGDVEAARDVLAQVKAFFPAFADRLRQQREARAHCVCDACTRIDHLALKAFVHYGELAIKQVRQFEELAGESVILVHRLLKNQVASREYVLMSEAARATAGLGTDDLQSHVENCEGVGEVALWLTSADAIPFDLAQRDSAPAAAAEIERSEVFHHLPR